MLGGVTVNLVLGFTIYMLIMFTWGKTIVKQDDLPYGLTATPVVEALGFQNGDRVLAFDGQPLEDAGDVFRYMLMRSPQTALVEHADGNQETIKIPEDIDTQLFKSGERPFYAYYPSILGVVTEDSPAAVAGLLEGDVIRSVNGYAISSWPEFTRYMESQTKPEISLEIQRADDLMSLDVPVDAEGKIGVGPLPLDITSTKLSYSIAESIEEGFWYGYYTLYDYVAQFKFVFTKQGVSQLGGFGTIGSLFPGAWDWQAFWHTTALISIILAFMNVLPIPALDGGHVMFLLYEMITGRKPHDKVLEVAQMIGIILLLGLFIYANANDVMRFLG
jgi:regulator of sigma E protease